MDLSMFFTQIEASFRNTHEKQTNSVAETPLYHRMCYRKQRLFSRFADVLSVIYNLCSKSVTGCLAQGRHPSPYISGLRDHASQIWLKKHTKHLIRFI